MKKIEKQPEEIKPVLIDAILMPNGEILCLGKVIGTFNKLKGYIYGKD